MAKIEISTTTGRFTDADLRAQIRDSKRFWASPAGQAAQRKLDAEKRSRKPAPTKFPEIAATTKTAAPNRQAMAAKLGIL